MKEETEVKILDYESPQTSFSALFSGKPKKFHVGWFQTTCAIYDIHVKDRYWPMDKHRSCSGAVTNGYLHCRFISCGFLINRFVVWCLKCQRMVEKRRSKPEMTSANVSFHLQPKFFAVYRTEEERNLKIFTFEKLESENYVFSFTQTDSLVIRTVGS